MMEIVAAFAGNETAMIILAVGIVIVYAIKNTALPIYQRRQINKHFREGNGPAPCPVSGGECVGVAVGHETNKAIKEMVRACEKLHATVEHDLGGRIDRLRNQIKLLSDRIDMMLKYWGSLHGGP